MICPTCGFDNVPGAESCAQCQQDLTHLDRPTPQDRIEESLLRDAVRDLNPAEPVTVRAEASLRDALGLMVLHNVGAVLVLGPDGRLAGILSERDVLLRVAGRHGDLDGLRAADFMTADPVTVGMEESLAFALHKMDVGDYRHLPVNDRGQAAGMISVRDLLRYVARLLKKAA